MKKIINLKTISILALLLSFVSYANAVDIPTVDDLNKQVPQLPSEKEPDASESLGKTDEKVFEGDEEKILKFSESIEGSFNLIINATGVLQTTEEGPEKTINVLKQKSMIDMMTINAIGPALLLKNFSKKYMLVYCQIGRAVFFFPFRKSLIKERFSIISSTSKNDALMPSSISWLK